MNSPYTKRVSTPNVHVVEASTRTSVRCSEETQRMSRLASTADGAGGPAFHGMRGVPPGSVRKVQQQWGLDRGRRAEHPAGVCPPWGTEQFHLEGVDNLNFFVKISAKRNILHNFRNFPQYFRIFSLFCDFSS